MTQDQLFCMNTLAEWCGGHHHLPAVHEFGTGICINHHGDLSTYDFNRLTNLVLLAHRDSVRIEIASSGPRMVKIIAHRRKPWVPSGTGMKQFERHPTLADLKAEIERIMS